MFNDTIAAISTAPADGAISIIRLSGPEALDIIQKIFDKDLSKKESHTITYGNIVNDGEVLDEVLVSLFRAPKSYTREDVVEINAHGGSFITQKILQLLLEKGARLAGPGEFTQRALLNGRINLSQAEAVNEMIEAENEWSARQAVFSLKGGIENIITPLTEQLLEVIAHIEVNIDYPEYDIEQLTYVELLPVCKKLLEKIDQLIDQAQQNMLLKKGLETAIIGKPNVGKSSLLNALLNEDKAIVTSVAGTTRDIVEGKIRLNNWQLNLIDTAGIHESRDMIEQLGIEKSKERMNQADLVLLVLDGSHPLDGHDLELLEMTQQKKRIILLNKEDLPKESSVEEQLSTLVKTGEIVSISAKEKNIDALIEALNRLFLGNLSQPASSLNTVRQISLLKKARVDMMNAIEALESFQEPDLIEIDLTACLEHLKEIIGKVSRDDLLDTLFSNFCLGK